MEHLQAAILHPDELERCREMYEKAFEQWEPFQLKHRLRRHDGEYRWVVIPQRRDLRHLGLEKTYADEMAESGGEPEDA